MKQNTKVFISGGAIIVAILILMVAATPGSTGSEINLEEAVNQSERYENRYITTEGFLIGDSIDWDANNVELRFDLEDDLDNTLSVYYEGVQPDNFSDDVIVIVHGYLHRDGVFEAERVQTRCPSSYESEDPEDYDTERHSDMLRDSDE
ncbi:cytochrome c maturation protein CcmE [Texcoconibacillus texcoconensis]|uniref:Cytochrome c-type biogenesis protein CcmE n=1 Tax=Texcoconibacillus texcoconensis TaxID=1095777 RepID=A0A840QU29_9BACI|nr:cytochrome c-type biogenesis protein CcmE [Texcoconibacillus texcoconensis]